jgi:gliding motility-associated protein GldC
MNKSNIAVEVYLDSQKLPEQILWSASDSTVAEKQKAKAMCLAFWDGAEKAALRIDLWTKDMMVDEMGDFYYQILMTMADTLNRATRQEELSEEMKTFAVEFAGKFRKNMQKQGS